jgi:hypothetical protein
MWEFVRLYLASLTLIAIFAWAVIQVYLLGVGAVPQQPPPGFLEERLETRLQWHSGNTNKKIQIQVAVDDPDFEKPFIDKPVSGNTHYINNLEPGHTYYWRLVQEGEASSAYTFKTAPNAVAF